MNKKQLKKGENPNCEGKQENKRDRRNRSTDCLHLKNPNTKTAEAEEIQSRRKNPKQSQKEKKESNEERAKNFKPKRKRRENVKTDTLHYLCNLTQFMFWALVICFHVHVLAGCFCVIVVHIAVI